MAKMAGFSNVKTIENINTGGVDQIVYTTTADSIIYTTNIAEAYWEGLDNFGATYYNVITSQDPPVNLKGLASPPVPDQVALRKFHFANFVPNNTDVYVNTSINGFMHIIELDDDI